MSEKYKLDMLKDMRHICIHLCLRIDQLGMMSRRYGLHLHRMKEHSKDLSRIVCLLGLRSISKYMLLCIDRFAGNNQERNLRSLLDLYTLCN